MAGTALIAGTGALPALLARHLEAEGTSFVLAEMEGFPCAVEPGWTVLRFRVERLAMLFRDLHAAGITRICFAGAVARPALDPSLIDADTAPLVARLLPVIGQGDDALLRGVLALFEEAGFEVVGAETILPGLLPCPGVLGAHAPTEADAADAARAAEILATTGPLDIGQGAVVAQGLCLALETLPGTDAMLDWVADVAAARRPNPQGARGVFYKAPKPCQDRRADLPAIGPDTVRRAAAAGLAGIVVAAGGVLLLDRDRLVAEADRLGLFLWARAE